MAFTFWTFQSLGPGAAIILIIIINTIETYQIVAVDRNQEICVASTNIIVTKEIFPSTSNTKRDKEKIIEIS